MTEVGLLSACKAMLRQLNHSFPLFFSAMQDPCKIVNKLSKLRVQVVNDVKDAYVLHIDLYGDLASLVHSRHSFLFRMLYSTSA